MPPLRSLSRVLYRLAGVPAPVDPEPALSAFADLVNRRSEESEARRATSGRIRPLGAPFPLWRQP